MLVCVAGEGGGGGDGEGVMVGVLSLGLLKFKFRLCLAPSGPPTNVTLVAAGEHSIMVHMVHPQQHLRNGVIRGFTVYYMKKGSLEPFPSAVNSSSTSVRLGNLLTFTEYVIKVSAFTSVGEGVASPPRTVFTQEGGKK